MKEILYLIVCVFIICNCTEESKRVPSNDKSTNGSSANFKKPLFWQEACKDNNFNYLFDCNTQNLFQVELLKSPIKDFVILTIDLNGSNFDIIYYSRFIKCCSKVNADSKYKVLKMENPVTKDTIIYLYEKPVIIKVKPKNIEINTFFTKYVWNLRPNIENVYILDPEIWVVKGRNEGKEVKVLREDFIDSTYYGNIQKILDLCKIKDYKYENR